MAGTTQLQHIQEKMWDGHLPLEIKLAASECRTYDQVDPYLISFPRLSYLPLLLPRLHAFFRSFLIDPSSNPYAGWFSYEDVPLKWHVPVGLLFDLYSPAEPFAPAPDSTMQSSASLPFRLTLHFTSWPEDQVVGLGIDGGAMHDAFINSVKEADFLRSGTAKPIMTLSKADSSALWNSVVEHDLTIFRRISNILLPSPSSPFRNVPLRIYIPSPDPQNPAIKTLQGLVGPTVPGATGRGQPQTLGGALNSLAPSIFPSRRVPVLARPVVQGIVVPMTAPVEELCRSAACPDGWLCVVVRMVG